MANNTKICKQGNPSRSILRHHPVIQNANIKISEFEKAWKSVDEIKAGLQRTEKKLKSIGKEPWDALIDIPAFSSSSVATELPHGNMYPDRDFIQDRQSNTISHRSSAAQVSRPSVRKISRLIDRRGEASRHPLHRIRHQHQSEEEEEEEDEDIFGDRKPIAAVVRSNVGGMFMPSWPSSSSLSSSMSPEPENQDSDTAFLTDPPVTYDSPPSRRLIAGFDHHPPRPPEQHDAMPVPLRTSRSLTLPPNFSAGHQPSGVHDAFGQQKNIANWPELAPSGPSDGLRKLKELIEHQKQQLAATTRVHSAPATARSSQLENDASPPRSQGQKPKAPPVRKVAPAPAVPVYRGFSRNQPPASQQEHVSPEKRKDLHNGITRKFRKSDKGQKNPRTKKVVKITANIQDFIICPSSWRKGQELILRELGPFKVSDELRKDEEEKIKEICSVITNDAVDVSTKPESDVNNSLVITPSSAKEESTIATQTSFSHLNTSRTNEADNSSQKSVGENFSSPERDKSPVSYDTSEKEKEKTLANNIRAILNANLSDNNLDKKGNDKKQEAVGKLSLQKNLTKSPTKNRSPTKRKKDSKPTVKEKRQQPVPKVRHYDPETVRTYISKQKAERTKRLQEEKQKKLQEAQQRNQKLQELQQRQKQLAKASIRKRINTQGELVDYKYDSSDAEDFDEHSNYLAYHPPEAKQYKPSADSSNIPNVKHSNSTKNLPQEKKKNQKQVKNNDLKNSTSKQTSKGVIEGKAKRTEQLNAANCSKEDNPVTTPTRKQETEPTKEVAIPSKIINVPKTTKINDESDVSPNSIENEELRSDNSPVDAQSETTSSLSLGSFESPVSNPISSRSNLEYLKTQLPSALGTSNEEVIPVLQAASASIERKLFLTNLAVSCQETVDQMIRKLKSYLPEKENVEDLDIPSQSFIGNANKSKMQRLEMLRVTAESLQQKISEETSRIKNSMHGISPIPVALLSGSPDINEPIELLGGTVGLDVEEPNYVGAVGGHHNQAPNAGQGEASGMVSQPGPSNSLEPNNERVRKSRSQFSVFEGNLPGIGSLLHHAHMVAEQQKQINAATKIQAAYRGYRVRKSLKWRLPLGGSLAAHIFKLPNLKSSFENNKSMINNSPFHEKSFDSSGSKPKEFGKNLFSIEYCASTSVKPKYKDESLHSQQHSRYSLEDIVATERPEPDPYNFINTLTRRLQQGDKWIGFPSLKRNSIDSVISSDGRSISAKDAVEEEEYRDDFETPSSPFISSLSRQSVPADGEAASGEQQLSSITITTPLTKSSNSNLEKSITITEPSAPSLAKSEVASHKVLHTSTPVENNVVGQKRGVTAAVQETDVDEFTLSEGPLSEKSDSSLSQGSLPSSSFSGESPNTSPSSTSSSILSGDKNKEESSLEEQSLEEENRQEAAVVSQSLERNESVDTVSALFNSKNVVLQYTPNALHLRLNAELTYLDSIEEGLRQIADVERVRSVALAQQETVAISQILQSEQHKWSEEVKKMSKMMTQEAEVRHQTMTEMQRQYEKAVAAAIKSHSEENAAINTTAQKLLETQAEAVRTTAEAAKQLAEAKVATLDLTTALQLQNANKMATETAAAAAVAAVTKVFDTMKHHSNKELVASDNSSGSRSSRSSHRSYSPAKEGSGNYTKSGRQQRGSPRSSAATSMSSISESIESDKINYSPTVDNNYPNDADVTLEGGPLPVEQQSLSEGSIPEEVDEASEYSDKFEESNSDSHSKDRHKGLKYFHKNSSLSSVVDEKIVDAELDQVSLSTDTSASEIVEDASKSQTLTGQNSFNKFTLQMVRQYVKEEELRSRHQLSLLRLREKSLIEKTKAELAWLEVQKQQLKEKGEEKLPAIRKKQRGLMLRLQQEQAEIRRLREAQKTASQERQILLQQQKNIAHLRHSTRNILGRIREVAPAMSALKVLTSVITPTQSHETSPKPTMNRPDSSSDAVPTDEELSLALDDSQSDNLDETSTAQSPKSEMLSETQVQDKEPKESPSKSSQSLENDILQGLKKLSTSKRYLNKREQKLFQRRKEIEELLIWRQKLDKEEAQIKAMEKQVVTLMELEKIKKHQGSTKNQDNAKHVKPATGVDGNTEMDENAEIIKNNVPNANSPSVSQIPEEVTPSSSAEVKSSLSIPLDSKLQPNQSGSESSITEDVPNTTQTNSIAEEIPAENIKSSPELINRTSSTVDYGGDSFEASSNSVVKQKLEPKVKRSYSPSVSLRLPLSPRTHVHKRRDSSGSDDSVTVSHSETASDVSDIEGRIHALKEELKQRKVEAERLRREQKRRNRERMRVQEASLLKQIEAYDRFILQTKAELERELELEAQLKVSVKPQIRQPKVAESRHLSKLSTNSPSNRLTETLPEDESPPHLISSQTSPLTTSRDDSIGSPSEQVSISSKRTSLESIDESLKESGLDVESQSTNKAGLIDFGSDIEKADLNSNLRVLSLEDSRLESDNDDSTSDSVKTVTELGDAKNDSKTLLEQASEKIDSKINIATDSEKISVVEIDKSTVEQNSKILVRQTTQSEFSDQILEDIVEIDDIVVTYSNASLHSLENAAGEDKQTDNENIKVESKISQQIIESEKESENDEAVSELIEEHLTEIFEDVKASKDETGSLSNSDVPATDVVSVVLQETYPEFSSPGELESDENKQNKLLPKEGKQFSKHQASADFITDIIIDGILKEAVNCLTQAKIQKEKMIIAAVHSCSRGVFLKEKTSLKGENLQDVMETSLLKSEPLEIIKRKAKHEEAQGIISVALFKSLFTEALDVIFNIYFSLRFFNPARIREELAAIMPFASPPKSSVSQRVADILSEIDRRSSQSSSPKDKPSPQDILTLSSPTAYMDVLSLSEGSSPTLGSPVKDLANRPSSPVLGEPGPSAQADLVSKPLALDGDNLLESELLPEQEWIDDDLGLENQTKIFQIYPFQQYYYIREIPNKPPPPYTPPGSVTSSGQPQPTLSRIDLKRSVQPEPYYAIPHTEVEVTNLVRKTLDQLYGASTEQLAAAVPPTDLTLAVRDSGEEDGDTEKQCRQAYVNFVFDLTKELLAEVREAAEPEPSCPLWTKPKWPSRRKIALLSREPPQLAASIEQNVLKLIGLRSTRSATPASSLAGLGRKKQDIVDEILVSELREEEIEWITYDEDELGVKNHIANSIFDCLLSETALLLRSLYTKHSNIVGPER